MHIFTYIYTAKTSGGSKRTRSFLFGEEEKGFMKKRVAFEM